MTREEIIGEIKYKYHHKKYEEALEDCINHLKDYPEDFYVMVYEARILLQLNKYKEADIIINDVLSREVSDTVRTFALEQGAKIAMSRKDYEKAISHYKNALYITTAPAMVKAKLAKLYIKINQFDKALEAIKDLEDPQSLVTKASIYIADNKPALAVDVLDSITDEKLENLSLLRKEACLQEKEYLMGIASLKYNQKKSAMACFKNAYQGNKHSRTYYESGYELAKLKYEERNLDSAIELCKRLVETADERYMLSKSCLLCGTIQMSRNDFVGAIESYTKSCRDDVRHYGLAQVEMAFGNYDNAFRLLSNNIFGSVSLYTRVLYSKLVLYYRQNRYAEFLQLYNIFLTMPITSEHKTNIGLMRLILESKKNLVYDYKTSIYENMQVLDYSIDKALIHTGNKYLVPANGKRFKSLDTVENLFAETRKKIESKEITPICDGVFDRYTIAKADIGFDGVNILSEASAIVIPGTSDIINMYPNDKSGFALEKMPDICDLKDDPKIRFKGGI